MIDLFYSSETYRLMVYVFVVLFGLFVGSFLNVVGLRFLKEESIVYPASHCPKCKTPIKFYDNIPILSYLFLGGKCRACKAPISVQYPIVEFSTAFLFFLAFYSYGFTVKTLGMMFLIAALVVVTITDLYEQYIYDVTSIWLAPFGLIYNLFNLGADTTRPDFVFQVLPEDAPISLGTFLYDGSIHLNGMFVSGIIGMLLAYVFFEGLSKVGEIMLGKPGFGMGDTKLCMGLAAWFGWEMLVIIIFISFVAQLFVGLPLVIYDMYKDKDYKSVGLSVALIVLTAVTVVLSFFPVKPQLMLFVLLVSSIVIVFILFSLLRRMRERESYTYLPLGPALVIGALVVIFYHETLYNVLLANNPLYLMLI